MTEEKHRQKTKNEKYGKVKQRQKNKYLKKKQKNVWKKIVSTITVVPQFFGV